MKNKQVSHVKNESTCYAHKVRKKYEGRQGTYPCVPNKQSVPIFSKI